MSGAEWSDFNFHYGKRPADNCPECFGSGWIIREQTRCPRCFPESVPPPQHSNCRCVIDPIEVWDPRRTRDAGGGWALMDELLELYAEEPSTVDLGATIDKQRRRILQLEAVAIATARTTNNPRR